MEKMCSVVNAVTLPVRPQGPVFSLSLSRSLILSSCSRGSLYLSIYLFPVCASWMSGSLPFFREVSLEVFISSL